MEEMMKPRLHNLTALFLLITVTAHDAFVFVSFVPRWLYFSPLLTLT